LLAEAERTVNSRPLSYIADSDTDFYLVRPLDIIHPLLKEEAPQNPLDPLVDPDCDPSDADFVAPGENRLHAKLIQRLQKSRRAADAFWNVFRDGYLAELRSRGVNRKDKQSGEPTIELGDLVIIKEPDVPRCDWRLALVTGLLPDQDGLIRTARVRFSRTHQEHTRALEHLYPIGKVPREPARCDTTASVDVFSLVRISESDDEDSSTASLVAGPRADPEDQATKTEDSGHPIDPKEDPFLVCPTPVGPPRPASSTSPPTQTTAAMAQNTWTRVLNVSRRAPGRGALAQKATERIPAAVDEQPNRIEELLRDHTDDQKSTTSAEDRSQDAKAETSW